MDCCTPFSALSFVTPKPSPMFDLKTELVPPLGLFLTSPFLIDSLNYVSRSMSKIPAAGVEVIVVSLEDHVLRSMMRGCVDYAVLSCVLWSK